MQEGGGQPTISTGVALKRRGNIAKPVTERRAAPMFPLEPAVEINCSMRSTSLQFAPPDLHLADIDQWRSLDNSASLNGGHLPGLD